ncbi:MAG: thioredoxin family protein, partial [Syntrophomonadaceae bacterium]|nr:thioredoxin family protein [Syntrophomonadaceae bacterium]
MKIEVLGTGCAKCKQLEKDVYNALAELDVAADVSKVQ